MGALQALSGLEVYCTHFDPDTITNLDARSLGVGPHFNNFSDTFVAADLARLGWGRENLPLDRVSDQKVWRKEDGRPKGGPKGGTGGSAGKRREHTLLVMTPKSEWQTPEWVLFT